jgi:Tfp pilus assembly protein PilF
LIVEKLPLFALSAIFCVITLLAQRTAMVEVKALPISLRLENAIVSIVRYLWNAIWPTSLYFGYPLTGEISSAEVILSALLIAALTGGALALRRRFPQLIVGWLWFVGMLVPVLGIVQVGGVSMADRYLYLPMIGLSIAVAFGVDAILRKPTLRVAGATLATIALVALATLTSIQVSYWKNSVTLFARALQINPDNFRIEHNYARALLMAGKGDEAIQMYHQLVARYPKQVIGWKSLAMALVAKGDLNEAARSIEPALALDPNDPEIPFVAAFIAKKQGRNGDAIELYRRTLALRDENVVAHFELCRLLATTDPKSAAEHARRAIDLYNDPSDPHIQTTEQLLNIGAIDQAEQSLYLALGVSGALGPEEQSTASAKQAEIEARCAERLR